MLVDARVEKDLGRAPHHVVRRFLRGLDCLADDPFRRRPGCDVKPLGGLPKIYRLRMGNWRILYDIDGDRRIVRVTSARRRGRAYR